MTALSFTEIKFDWQGLSSFDSVLKKQLEKVREVIEGGEPCVLACEHPTVITLGKRSQNFNDLLIPLKTLREKNIEIFSIDRGGHATLHNPGQLVIYPIVPLRRMGMGVRQFVEILEITTAHFLAEHGLEVTRGYEPGLWVNDKKIAAFGIRIDRGVSYHGLAINIYNDLEPFKLIRQCGVVSRATNLREEMAAFMSDVPSFRLEQMARLWVSLFSQEVRRSFSGTTFEDSALPVDLLPGL